MPGQDQQSPVRSSAVMPLWRVARDASRVLLESGGALKLTSRRKRSKCEASLVMPTQSQPIVPPALKVHAKDLPLWRFLPAFSRNTVSTLPDYAFDVLINRRRVLGIESMLVNDPDGVRHVLATAIGKY